MTAAAFARVTVHRIARARTFEEVQQVGDALGVSRDLPFAVYIRRFRQRYIPILLLASSVPLVVTGRGLVKN